MDANVVQASAANFNNLDTPELKDFGMATFVGNNGATNQIRVDWLTLDGLSIRDDGLH